MFAQPDSSTGRIFIPGIVAGQVTMAFFGAKNEIVDFTGFLKLVHFVGDILETHQ